MQTNLELVYTVQYMMTMIFANQELIQATWLCAGFGHHTLSLKVAWQR